jgi:hypothetical protein
MIALLEASLPGHPSTELLTILQLMLALVPLPFIISPGWFLQANSAGPGFLLLSISKLVNGPSDRDLAKFQSGIGGRVLIRAIGIFFSIVCILMAVTNLTRFNHLSVKDDTITISYPFGLIERDLSFGQIASVSVGPAPNFSDQPDDVAIQIALDDGSQYYSFGYVDPASLNAVVIDLRGAQGLACTSSEVGIDESDFKTDTTVFTLFYNKTLC